MSLDALDIAAVPREELPSLLGRLVEAEARVRLRLADPATTAPQDSEAARLLPADEAAAIAGTSPRWLLAATRGMRFRHDLSRKQPRFDEGGLRRWLAERRKV